MYLREKEKSVCLTLVRALSLSLSGENEKTFLCKKRYTRYKVKDTKSQNQGEIDSFTSSSYEQRPARDAKENRFK